MAYIDGSLVKDIARELFIEAYEGAQGPATWFVNNEPANGVFGSIAKLTAEEASQELIRGGRSVAAHVEHLRWSLANVNSVARGGAWNPDWSTSWQVQTVDREQWETLQTSLRREYELVLEALGELPPDAMDRELLTGVLSLAPHAAHHLGTIRQIVSIIVSRR